MADQSDDSGFKTASTTPPRGIQTTPPVATLRLVLAGGKLGAQQRWALTGNQLRLGRSLLATKNGFVDTYVSRNHAALERTDKGWLLKDLGSCNHTYLNGLQLTEAALLRSGDVIRLGSTILMFAHEPQDLNRRADGSELVGSSMALSTVRQAIAQVAARETSVLVMGETGVGKELVANEIHHLSGRSGDFVPLNCSGLNEGMLEGELFGHKKGAFTDAVKDHDGVFRAADHGTLFLDELGEMPLHLQAKLLRALETKSVRPVGSSKEVKVDVRVVAATNRDLPADVREGRFRRDLYGRLAQWIITVPPLRQRREDLPELILHQLHHKGAAQRPLTAPLVEALLTHDWPLNVRGLFNVLSVALMTAPDDGPLDLSPQIEQSLANDRKLNDAAPAPPGPPRKGDTPSLMPAEELKQLLEGYQGRVSAMAEHLGCSRQQVYRWLRLHGLDPDAYRPRRTPPASLAVEPEDKADGADTGKFPAVPRPRRPEDDED